MVVVRETFELPRVLRAIIYVRSTLIEPRWHRRQLLSNGVFARAFHGIRAAHSFHEVSDNPIKESAVPIRCWFCRSAVGRRELHHHHMWVWVPGTVPHVLCSEVAERSKVRVEWTALAAL